MTLSPRLLALSLVLAIAAPAAATGPATTRRGPASKGAADARPADAKAEPWDGEPFAADPKEIAAAAARVEAPDGSDVVVLLEEGRFRYDEKGRLENRYRLVYRILDVDGTRGWDSIESAWAPWYEERPVLRARVVQPDGRSFELDPKTIAEGPAGSPDEEIYSDRRILRAPLPAISVGSVVEEMITTRETSPFFDAGTSSSFWFGKSVPVRKTRLVVEAPESLQLRTQARGLTDAEPRMFREGNLVRRTWESGPTDPLDPPPPGLPPEASAWPHVSFSTGKSWAHLALRYSEIVDAQLGKTDLKKVVREATAGTKGRDAAIAKLLDRVRRDLRYAAVELGECSIVPRTPTEALSRKYGDCKDQASYLVGLLRAAGIPAFVALLRTGPGTDVEPDLPGFGGFDHAIVQIPGPPAIWIDPTDEYAAAGALPAPDQGRLALVASPVTRALVRTPEASADTNVEVETREFFLAERGSSRVVQTLEAKGPMESRLRHEWTADDKQVREFLDGWIDETWRSKKLGKYEISPVADLSRPFRVRIEALEAGRGITTEDEAVVALFPWELAGRLPEYLQGTDDAGDDEGTGAATDEKPKKAKKKRTVDHILPEAFATEWRYRIVPPAGYRLSASPDFEIPELGPARLTRDVKTNAKGEIEATFRFEVRQRRSKPEEYDALRAGLRKLRKTGAALFRFEQIGEAHLAAGRLKEAVAEFRRLATLHPKEALHHAQLSGALLAAGCGDAAREEARRAVALEPGSAVAHSALGEALAHDLVGRSFHAGFDRAGSLAASRKAKELDPKDAASRARIALLLECNASAVRYGKGADLAGAITEYQALRTDLENKALDENLLFALARAGRFDDLEKTAREGMKEGGREGMVLTAVAARKGADAAIAEAARILPDAERRRAAVERAGNILVLLRHYPEGGALLAEAARGAANGVPLRTRAETVRKIRHYEETKLPADDPRSAIQALLAALVDAKPDDAATLSPLLAKRSAAALFPKGPVTGRRRLPGGPLFLRIVWNSLRANGIPPEVGVDATMGATQWNTDGDAKGGWRLRVQASGAGGSATDTWYVVLEDGRARILANELDTELLGAEALRRVDAGDLDGARRLLDWAREETSLPGGDDPLAGAAFPRLWTKGSTAGADEIRVAAAALLAEADEPADALEPLRAARQKPGLDPARATAIDIAIARALVTLRKASDLLPVVERLAPVAPDSLSLWRLRASALSRLGRWDEVRRLAEGRLAKDPDDLDAVGTMTSVLERAGEWAAAEKLLRPVAERGKAGAIELNGLAWNALFSGGSLDRAIEDGQKAAELGRRRDSAVLHTLAALYAETGRIGEAHETIETALDVSGYDEPQPHDWWVFGRIAEQLGLVESAVAAYRKVEKPEADSPVNGSTWQLAEKRLAILGRGGKKK